MSTSQCFAYGNEKEEEDDEKNKYVWKIRIESFDIDFLFIGTW